MLKNAILDAKICEDFAEIRKKKLTNIWQNFDKKIEKLTKILHPENGAALGARAVAHEGLADGLRAGDRLRQERPRHQEPGRTDDEGVQRQQERSRGEERGRGQQHLLAAVNARILQK